MQTSVQAQLGDTCCAWWLLTKTEVEVECYALAHSHFDWNLNSRLGDVDWQLSL